MINRKQYRPAITSVSRSPRDSMLEDLPVWLVESWEEITDEAELRVEQKMKGEMYKLVA